MTVPVHVLGSYFYFRTSNLAELLGPYGGGIDFLADSGAFSAFTTGATITVDEYAAWLRENASSIDSAITLDIIGDPVGTRRNTDRLVELVGGAVPVLPVFHVGSPWDELERICASGAPYVCLGGAVHLSGRGKEEAMLRWCIRAHKIVRHHGVKLHGLGLTRPPYSEVLPWYSTDSAYWTSGGRTGTLSLFDGRKLVTLRAGKGTRGRAAGYGKLLRAYGCDPAAFAAPGFGIVREVGPRARRDREWFRTASVLSFRRYETAIRNRRGLVAPPDGLHNPGLKVHFALGTPRDVATVVPTVRSLDRPAAA